MRLLQREAVARFGGCHGAGLRKIFRRVPGAMDDAVRVVQPIAAAGLAAAPVTMYATSRGVRTLSTSSATAAGGAASAGGAPRVCILGGGFGGLYTAIKLETLMWPRGTKPQVTLIDQGERFVFKPLLYELISGTANEAEVAPTFAQLLAPYPVTFVQDKVQGVQLDPSTADTAGDFDASPGAAAGRVLLAGGGAVDYDWLVVALGAESDARGVPGVRELALKFTDLEDAVALRDRLAALEAAPYAPLVVVVGAGYAGCELAAVVAERLRGRGAVQVVTPAPAILDTSPPGQREAAEKVLNSLGVEQLTSTLVKKLTPAADADAAGAGSSRCVVHLGPTAAAAAAAAGAGAGAAESAAAGTSGRTLEADLVLWTAGSSPATKFSQALPFPTDKRGFLETEPTLRVASHPRVFAIGDVSMAPDADARAPGSFYPTTAQVALQAADYAAWNIWASINGRALLPFRYQHLGNMMSLGAANAAVSLPVELPAGLVSGVERSPLAPLLTLAGVRLGEGVTLEGPLAQLLRRCAYLYRQPTNEQRLSIVASWVEQAAQLAMKLAAPGQRGGPGASGAAG